MYLSLKLCLHQAKFAIYNSNSNDDNSVCDKCFIEAESDPECGRSDWCCDGRYAAQLWLLHQVIVNILTVLTHIL